MTAYVCTKCGNSGAEPIAARPALDDRYALGRCPCTPPPAPRKNKLGAFLDTKWPPIPLVRADLWDPAMLTERARSAAEAALIKAWCKNPGRLGDSAKQQVDALFARWRQEARERGNPEA